MVLSSLHRLGRLFVAVSLLGTFLVLCGCPRYEEEHSGHYREIDIDELQDEAISIDLFRFGDNVRAVLRHYDISSSAARENPFDPSNETHCRWSDEAQFDNETRQFSLLFRSTARMERVELEGQIENNGLISLVIDREEADEPRELQLLANESSPPNARCTTIDDFLLRAIFDDNRNGENRLDPDIYQLRNPVFALLWVGVQPETHDGVLIYVGLNRTGPAIRLAQRGMVDFNNNALTDALSVSIPPPPEQLLVESGDTRYALGHFVVIDDSEDQDGSFSWNISDEPIVASSLEDSLPEGAPEHLNINGWGKAMLFVEGRLDELHPSTRLQLTGIEDADPNRHFYIVDIYFYNEDVKLIELPERPSVEGPIQNRVPVQLTERYLEASGVPVPRLFPYN